jgi:hypothetical protein
VVADGDRLLLLLGRVRRRMHAQTALQGGLTGALAAIAVADLWLLLAGTNRPAAASAAGWALLLLGPLLGAGWWLWRRPTSLARAARLVDRVNGRGAGDRVFLALALRDSPAPLAHAALQDGLRRALAAPLAAVAPWRRPRGLGLLGLFGGLTALLLVWPWQSAAQGTRASATTSPPAAPGSDGALAEARAELERLQRAAVALGDADLLGLIAEAEKLLAAGTASGAGERDLQQRLSALAAAAHASARTSATLADAIGRVAEALSTAAQTRAWAEALSRLESRASEREAQVAANRLSEMGAAERAALSQALARAAAAADAVSRQGQTPSSEEAEEQRRRLDGLGEQRPPQAEQPEPAGERRAAASPERSLKRLERDLRESADACLRDPEACARGMGQAAGSLASEMARARSAAERGQLARALERELARRASAAQAARGSGAPGQPGSAAGAGGEAVPAPGSGQSAGEEQAAGAAEQGQSAGQSPATAAAVGSGTGAGTGQSAGEGGDPESGRSLGGAGEKREVRLPSGPGPSRAEVIEGSARGGFSQPGYRRVYGEYEAAVEEALDATAVPPGRRRLVRRYFDVIHPR